MQEKLEVYSKQASNTPKFDYQLFKEWVLKDWHDLYPGFPLRIKTEQCRLWFDQISRYASIYKLNRG